MVTIENKFYLRELRQINGMTQGDLARALGLRSPSTITMWENGSRHPPNMALPRLADILHCSIDELFGRAPGARRPAGWILGNEWNANTKAEEGEQLKPNGVEVTILYADNDPYLVKVCFVIPGGRWSEFEKSPMYRQLTDYARSLQTPDKQTGRSGPECTTGNGNEKLTGSSNPGVIQD